MKILILGGKGFIGSHLLEALSLKYDVIAPTRSEVDFSKTEDTLNFFKDKNFNLVINVSSEGGKTGNNDTSKILYNNLSIIFNLLRVNNHYKYLFNFTSGYELDKNINHSGISESFMDYFPLDYYGMSKNIISRICSSYSKIYTFRIFGAFGEYENNSRFIKNNIINYINNQPLTISQNRYWDFVYIKDIIKITDYYINNITKLPNNIDIACPEKYKFTDIADIINNLENYKVNVKIDKEGLGLDYMGDSKLFVKILPNYTSLEDGIKYVYNYVKKTL